MAILKPSHIVDGDVHKFSSTKCLDLTYLNQPLFEIEENLRIHTETINYIIDNYCFNDGSGCGSGEVVEGGNTCECVTFTCKNLLVEESITLGAGIPRKRVERLLVFYGWNNTYIGWVSPGDITGYEETATQFRKDTDILIISRIAYSKTQEDIDDGYPQSHTWITQMAIDKGVKVYGYVRQTMGGEAGGIIEPIQVTGFHVNNWAELFAPDSALLPPKPEDMEGIRPLFYGIFFDEMGSDYNLDRYKQNQCINFACGVSYPDVHYYSTDGSDPDENPYAVPSELTDDFYLIHWENDEEGSYEEWPETTGTVHGYIEPYQSEETGYWGNFYSMYNLWNTGFYFEDGYDSIISTQDNPNGNTTGHANPNIHDNAFKRTYKTPIDIRAKHLSVMYESFGASQYAGWSQYSTISRYIRTLGYLNGVFCPTYNNYNNITKRVNDYIFIGNSTDGVYIVDVSDESDMKRVAYTSDNASCVDAWYYNSDYYLIQGVLGGTLKIKSSNTTEPWGEDVATVSTDGDVVGIRYWSGRSLVVTVTSNGVLSLWDISDVTTIVLKNTYNYIKPDGEKLLFSDIEFIDENTLAVIGQNYLIKLDITDVNNIVEDTVNNSYLANGYNIKLLNGYLVIIDAPKGIKIVDPENFNLKETWQTQYRIMGTGYKDNYLYIYDVYNGIFNLHFDIDANNDTVTLSWDETDCKEIIVNKEGVDLYVYGDRLYYIIAGDGFIAYNITDSSNDLTEIGSPTQTYLDPLFTGFRSSKAIYDVVETENATATDGLFMDYYDGTYFKPRMEALYGTPYVYVDDEIVAFNDEEIQKQGFSDWESFLDYIYTLAEMYNVDSVGIFFRGHIRINGQIDWARRLPNRFFYHKQISYKSYGYSKYAWAYYDNDEEIYHSIVPDELDSTKYHIETKISEIHSGLWDSLQPGEVAKKIIGNPQTIMSDGRNPMDKDYVPSSAFDIATKGYVDAASNIVYKGEEEPLVSLGVDGDIYSIIQKDIGIPSRITLEWNPAYGKDDNDNDTYEATYSSDDDTSAGNFLKKDNRITKITVAQDDSYIVIQTDHNSSNGYKPVEGSLLNMNGFEILLPNTTDTNDEEGWYWDDSDDDTIRYYKIIVNTGVAKFINDVTLGTGGGAYPFFVMDANHNFDEYKRWRKVSGSWVLDSNTEGLLYDNSFLRGNEGEVPVADGLGGFDWKAGGSGSSSTLTDKNDSTGLDGQVPIADGADSFVWKTSIITWKGLDEPDNALGEDGDKYYRIASVQPVYDTYKKVVETWVESDTDNNYKTDPSDMKPYTSGRIYISVDKDSDGNVTGGYMETYVQKDGDGNWYDPKCNLRFCGYDIIPSEANETLLDSDGNETDDDAAATEKRLVWDDADTNMMDILNLVEDYYNNGTKFDWIWDADVSKSDYTEYTKEDGTWVQIQAGRFGNPPIVKSDTKTWKILVADDGTISTEEVTS